MINQKKFFSVFITDISDISDRSYEKVISFSDSLRRERAKRFCRIDDKKRCIAAGILLDWLLKCNNNFSNYQVMTDKNSGKPFIQKEDFFFNLSHSGKFVAVASCDVPVGLDIEQKQIIKPNVFEHCMTPEELSFFSGLEDSKKNDAFIKLWTLKESYSKMTGMGLYDSFNAFQISPLNDNIFTVVRDSVCQKALIFNSEIDNDYFLSVCVNVSPDSSFSQFPPVVSHIDFNRLISELSEKL